MPTIYLDVCCLNRPFDDQGQSRIRLEAEAVLLLISMTLEGRWQWVSSEVVDLEISSSPDPDRRERVRLLASGATVRILLGSAEVARAKELERIGFRSMDALHLACAESGGATVFLTTDDRLLRRGRRLRGRLAVEVANPLDWLQEVPPR